MTLVNRLLTVAVMCLAALSATAPPSVLTRYEARRLSMACVYDIAVYGDAPSDVPAVLEKALDEVDRIDRLMSHYKPQSPLSQLNRAAASSAVVVESELFDFIARSLDYSVESDGAFDITVGPLMRAWGFFKGDGRVPTDVELSGAQRRVGYRHVVIDRSARTIRFDIPGVELDLGGIAKGYAVDRVVALLQRHGITAALVSAGGSTVYALGHPPDRRSWDVKIQDPLEPGRVAFSVGLTDRALSMAGRSAKSFEANGVLYSHIMDPRTGRPVQGILSVAVTSATGTECDALDDALFVMGVQASRRYLKRFAGAEAWFWLPNGTGGARVVRMKGALRAPSTKAYVGPSFSRKRT
jgi:FAD:protein FMN transferase